MYPLICDIISGTHNNTALVTTQRSPVSKERQRELLAMHARLAHVGAAAVCKLHPGLARKEMQVIQSCEACLQAKMVRRSYPDVPAGLKARRPGEDQPRRGLVARPAIKAPRSVRRRTVRKDLDQEAERGVLSNLGRISSPFRHA